MSRTLSRPVPRYVGRISYAWYLWHWPVLVLATARWGEATTGDDGAAASSHAPATVVVAAVALSFVLAAASHHVVEQPLRRARFLVLSRRRSLAAGGILVAMSLVASAGLVLSTTATGEQGTVAAPPTGTQAPALQVEGSSTPVRGSTTPEIDPATLREPNTPEEAREDQPQVAPCYVGYEPTTVPAAEECRVGPARGAERTIALIGDSHATAWYPAFRRAAEQRGWTLYFFGKSACPVVDVEVRRAGTTARYDACSRWRENVLDRLDGIEGLDAVVIGRWMAYKNSTLQPDGSASSSSTVGVGLGRGCGAHVRPAAPRHRPGRRHGGRPVAGRGRPVVPVGAPPRRRGVRLLAVGPLRHGCRPRGRGEVGRARRGALRGDDGRDLSAEDVPGRVPDGADHVPGRAPPHGGLQRHLVAGAVGPPRRRHRLTALLVRHEPRGRADPRHRLLR